MKNNLRLLALALGIGVAMPALAQKDNVGIGTTKPDQSAILDLNSSNKGLLMPRMSLQQRGAIQNPAQGLVIYQTDFLSGFYFYNGTEWKAITNETNANSVASDPNDWSFGGNSISSTDFLGSTNDVPLKFKVGNVTGGYISSNTNKNLVAIGKNAGATNISTGGDGSGGGISNVAIGTEALMANTTGGNYNMAIGERALKANTVGVGNTAIGALSLFKNVGGTANMAFGYLSLFENVGGNYNVAIGQQALLSSTGSNNVGIGTDAGYSATGTGNTFIGHQSGYSEAGSNKLYIANSNTALPLIYGDFSAKFISIGDVGVAGDPAATLVKRNNLAAQYGLLVQKGILTEKIKVATMTTADWADYVFEKDYKRMSLEEVEQFVKENKHLPNVPTTVEMMASGSDLIKTDAKLLEKIEELTLYMIEMNKEIKALKVENEKLRK